MTRRVLVTVAFVLSAANAFAQSAVPPAGLVAEGAGEWTTALEIYRAALDRDPHDAALWRRVADIEAHLGNVKGAASALEHAVQAYRRLAKASPDDPDVSLNLARVSAWSGRTDDAVTAYRRYLRGKPDAGPVWIELARAETWRGNYDAALEALDAYQRRFGRDDRCTRERAAVLARAGRPREALDLIEPLLAAHPDDYELNLTRTIALVTDRRAREASDALDTLRRLQPQATDTRSAERIVRETLASTADPGATFYRDSSTLEIQRVEPKATVALGNGTTIGGGLDAQRLRAGKGSGLEQVDGTESARYDQTWIRATHQAGPINFRGRVGFERTSTEELAAYVIGADFSPADSVKFSLERQSGLFVLSPRTVGLGLEQVTHAGRVEWAAGSRTVIAFDGRHQSLSDGNTRWELTFAPRYSVARTARVNLDLGVTVAHLNARTDLDNGYWDPSHYQYYGVTAYPYFKVSESIGLGMSLGFGAQRDTLSPAFRPGGHASVEATVGIYQPWALKFTGGGSFNQRLGSGAFDGYSAGLALIRRF